MLTTTPAHALFGSILAGIQRAQMIANQGVQIYKDTMAKITFDRPVDPDDGSIRPPEGASARKRRSADRSVHRSWHLGADSSSSVWAYRGKTTLPEWRRSVADSVEQMGESGKSFTGIVVARA